MSRAAGNGDACTVSDKCSGAICLAGTKLGCNDSEPCTTDSCDVKVGCVYTPLPDKDPCTDSNPCTLVDACAKGKCTGSGVKDVDNDGHIDSKCPGGDDCDDDNDDWCDVAFTIPPGFTPKTCSKGGGDCDDAKSAINPAAIEKLEISLDIVGNNATSNNSGKTLLDAGAAANGTTWVAWTASNSWSQLGSNIYVAWHSAGAAPWTITLVPGLNFQTPHFKLAIDTGGVPHFAAVDASGAVVHGVWAPTGWTIEKVAGQAVLRSPWRPQRSAIQPSGLVNVGRFPRTGPARLLRGVRAPSSRPLQFTGFALIPGASRHPFSQRVGRRGLFAKGFPSHQGCRSARCRRRRVHPCTLGQRS